MCLKYFIRITENMSYIRDTKFEWRSWSILWYSKRYNLLFFLPIRVFTSLGVTIFRVKLRDHVQMYLLKQFTKMMWLDLFSFSLHGSNVKCEKILPRKNISYFEGRLLQCKLNKAKVNYLEEWSDKYFHFTFVND